MQKIMAAVGARIPRGPKYAHWRLIPDLPYNISRICHPCFCCFEDCEAERAYHLLGAKVTRMPLDLAVFRLWASYLGYEQSTEGERADVDAAHAAHVAGTTVLYVALSTHFPSDDRVKGANGAVYIPRGKGVKTKWSVSTPARSPSLRI